MKIEWNKVTWYSKVASFLVILGIFGFGIFLGYQLGIIRGDDYKQYLLVSYTRHTPAELKNTDPNAEQQAELDIRKKIVGSWKNDANTNQVINYNNDGLAAVFSLDQPITTFTWSVESTGGNFFIRETGAPDRLYKILSVDEKKLQLQYMYNSKILTYSKH